jgi:hypothetical protein
MARCGLALAPCPVSVVFKVLEEKDFLRSGKIIEYQPFALSQGQNERIESKVIMLVS